MWSTLALLKNQSTKDVLSQVPGSYMINSGLVLLSTTDAMDHDNIRSSATEHSVRRVSLLIFNCKTVAYYHINIYIYIYRKYNSFMINTKDKEIVDQSEQLRRFHPILETDRPK